MKKLIVILLLAVVLSLAGCMGRVGDESVPMPEAPTEAYLPAERTLSTADGETYLALHTPDYRERTVADFDSAFAPYRNDYGGYGPRDPLPDFKKSLLYALMQTIGEEDGSTPVLNVGMGVGDWVVSYDVYWRVDDPLAITVGQRDDLIDACRERAEAVLVALPAEQLEGPEALSRLRQAVDGASCAQSIGGARAWVEAESICSAWA